MTGDLGLSVVGGEEHLDGLAFGERQHHAMMPPPLPPCAPNTACARGSRTPLAPGVKDGVRGQARSAFPEPPARSDQNFRNRGGQSCWTS